MFVREKVRRSTQRVVASRKIAAAASVLGAATIFALALAAPVTIDSGIFTLNTAQAAAGGGGNGGGNSGGNGGGDGGGDGGGSGGGNDGKAAGQNKDNDVASTSTSTSSSPDSSSPANDRELLQPLEGAVTLAQFTTRISKRYPANEISTHSNPQQAVTFFSEVQAMSGKQITHRWRYRGELAFEATFEIRGDLWRVWSTQLLPADMPGAWQVEILDGEGKVLDVHTLDYLPKAAAIATN